MRRLRNRRYRNPADPKVSHAQPPLHVNADTRGLGRWCACILRGFSGPVAELAATGLTVACGGRMRNRGQVVAAGVSLGGNALMRWAGEQGQEALKQVKAVASICSPLDLAASGKAIGEGFNRQVYTRMFLRSMKPKALAKLKQHPGLFDAQRMLDSKDLYEFDNVFTAPLHGFQNTDDYWRRASALPLMANIQIPALALNALNDPFIPADSLPSTRIVSPCVELWQPPHGGHVGFAKGVMPGHLKAMPEAVGTWLIQHLS